MSDDFAPSPYAPKDLDNVPEEPIDEFVDEHDDVVVKNPPRHFQLSFWGWVRQQLFRQDVVGRLEERLRILTYAIERHPDGAANYVLRGEFWLVQGDYESARSDFEIAAELAAAEFEDTPWGIMAQGLRDRALNGLKRSQRQ